MTEKNSLRAYISVILTMTFWAISYVWIKIVYELYQPVTVVFLRLIIGSLFLLLLITLLKRKEKIRRQDWKFFILLSLVQPFLYFLCESYGLKYVSPTVAAVIVSTIPLITPFAAVWVLKEKISALNILGLIISFGGVLLVIIKKDFTLSASPIGLLLLLGSVAAGVIYTTTVKKVTQRYNALTIVTIQNILGIFWFLPLFLIFDLNHFLAAAPRFKPIVVLLLLALLPTALAFVLFAYAIKRLGAAKTSMFGNIMPVLTAIFAWLILGEHLTTQMSIGILVVISGLFISQVKGKKNS